MIYVTLPQPRAGQAAHRGPHKRRSLLLRVWRLMAQVPSAKTEAGPIRHSLRSQRVEPCPACPLTEEQPMAVERLAPRLFCNGKSVSLLVTILCDFHIARHSCQSQGRDVASCNCCRQRFSRRPSVPIPSAEQSDHGPRLKLGIVVLWQRGSMSDCLRRDKIAKAGQIAKACRFVRHFQRAASRWAPVRGYPKTPLSHPWERGRG